MLWYCTGQRDGSRHVEDAWRCLHEKSVARQTLLRKQLARDRTKDDTSAVRRYRTATQDGWCEVGGKRYPTATTPWAKEFHVGNYKVIVVVGERKRKPNTSAGNCRRCRKVGHKIYDCHVKKPEDNVSTTVESKSVSFMVNETETQPEEAIFCCELGMQRLFSEQLGLRATGDET